MESWSPIVLMIIIELLCISCRFEVTEPVAVVPSPENTKNHLNQQDSHMDVTEITQSTLGLPEDLQSKQALWEVEQTVTPNKAASISRVYEDGRLYTWSNTRRVISNGKVSREPASYAWRLDAQISPEGIEQLRELIRSEFVKLPSNNSVTTGLDQGYVIWKSHLDSIEHRIMLPTSASIDLPQVIRDINYAIQSNIIPGAVPQTQ